MPPWLRLVVTSRPESVIVDALRHFQPKELECDANQDDARAYLRHMLAGKVAPADADAAMELLLARSELLPLLRAAAEQPHEMAFDELALQDPIRRLGYLVYNVIGSLPPDGPPHGASSPSTSALASPSPLMTLPYWRPLSLTLYLPLLGCMFGDSMPGGGMLSVEASAELAARLLTLRSTALPISEHTHLLSCLQRCFGRWMQVMAQGGSAGEEVQMRLARALRATARQLLAHLHEKYRHGGNASGMWGDVEVADHAAVVPSIVRFLHGLMLDYHAAFHGAGVDVSLGVLREVVAAYFELHAIAVVFAVPARMPAAKCLRTEEELRASQEAATRDADEATEHAARVLEFAECERAVAVFVAIVIV